MWFRFPWLPAAFSRLEEVEVVILSFSNGCVLAHQIAYYLGKKVKAIVFASGVPGLQPDFGRPCLEKIPCVFVGGEAEEYFGGLAGLKGVAEDWKFPLVQHSAGHCFEPVSVWPQVLAHFHFGFV